MRYEEVLHFAQTVGLVLLILLFLAGVAFALWPRNRERFQRAARLPLEED